MLNYQPIYSILSAAQSTYNNQMAGKAWMYTEASYAQAMLAMRRVALCDPNLYDYAGRGVGMGATLCAAAIKQAVSDYAAIDLVKKTATVHIAAGEGTSVTVLLNGAALSDGDTVEYGDVLTGGALALSAYDQSTPALTVSGGIVNGSSTTVNEPDIYFSTADLPLNTYTLTFDPNGGTLSGSDEATATYTQPLPAATAASRPGYTFQRYSYSAGASDYTYYNQNFENVHGNYDVKGNVTVIAQWTPVNYSVSFIPGEGSVDAAALTNFGNSYTIEDTKSLPTVTAPVGYHFDGWTVASSNASDAHGWGTEKIAQNASVEGKWGSVTLTATFAPNTDTAYTVETYQMGTDGAYPSAPTSTQSFTGTTGAAATADTAAPTGFTFDSANVSNVLSAPIAADGSTVLKVYFSRNRYTVSVTLGEGAALNVANGAQYYYGETVAFSVSALTGYDPDSAVLTVNGETAANGASFTVEDDITVAVSDLSLLQLSLTVTPGVGTRILGAAQGEYDYGSSFTVSAEATGGYNPAGLKLRVNGAVVSVPYTFTLTADTVISTDDLNKYRRTVTVTAGAGTVVSGAGTYDYGDTVTVYAEGLDGFSGDVVLRLDGEAVANPYVFTITEDRDFTTDDRTPLVYHTVVFNNYDNTKLYETQVLDGGTAVYVGDDPAKPDEGTHSFTFAGWDKSLENITETTVFTAQFTTVHDYSVTGYDANEHYLTCSRCGEIKEGSRIPHDPTTVTDVTATCDTNGMVHDECGCGYVSAQRSIGTNPDNHVKTSDAPAVTASCVNEGFTAGVFCSGCNTYISGHASTGFDYTETGHSYGDPVPNGNGTHTRTCTREGCTDAVANHTVTEDCAGTAATCHTLAVCNACGAAFGELNAANHEDLQPVTANAATCTEPGNNAYYYCSACGNSYTDAEGTVLATQEDIVIPASGHSWSVTWTWDDSVIPPTATAAFACAKDHDHDVTVNAEVAEIASTAAHCGEAGSVTYRASYNMDGVTYTTAGGNDKTVEEDALPHLWAVESWVWSENHSTVTLNLKCTRDPNHMHSIPGIAAQEVQVSPAGCEADRVVKYAASASYEGYTFETETDHITLTGTAAGHDYDDTPEWIWAQDYSAATARFTCKNCPHTATVTDEHPGEHTRRAADCEYDRVVYYTADVTFKTSAAASEAHFAMTTDDVTLAGTKTAHDWGEIAYTWADDNSTVTATRTCRNYSSHVETETVSTGYSVPTAPTYENAGEGLYTAVFTNPAFGTKTKTVTIPALKAQIETALAESGSDIPDIDALLETAGKIVNAESPYEGPCEAGYISGISGLIDAFNADKNDPAKVEALAGTLGEIGALVNVYEDHIVYNVTYVLGGGTASNKTSFVRTDAAFALTAPVRSGYVFTGWTGTGLSELTLNVTVDPADAENKTFTANWTVDNSEAQAALNNAAALIADADDEYEDDYSAALSDLADGLNEALAADPQDPDAIRGLIDAINEKIAQKGDYRHSFTVELGYKEGFAPTCTEAGIKLMQCANCDKTVEAEAAALGHDMGEWTVVTPADFGVNGEARRDCSRCDYYETKELVMTGEYDRQIRFNTVSKMYYVLDVGDGYNVYNTNTILWYSAAELRFYVYVYTNSGITSYDVYINGEKASQDPNGYYTLPAGSVSDTVSIVTNGGSAPSDPSGSGDTGDMGVCELCGKTHPNTLWGRIIALFHAIMAFFKNLFKK